MSNRKELGSPTKTVEEVAMHSSKKSVWIVVDGMIFDVTDFLATHPGGEQPILRSARLLAGV
jgi:L-lactate dehydrogenase (cytochrome)